MSEDYDRLKTQKDEMVQAAEDKITAPFREQLLASQLSENRLREALKFVRAFAECGDFAYYDRATTLKMVDAALAACSPNDLDRVIELLEKIKKNETHDGAIAEVRDLIRWAYEALAILKGGAK